MKSIIKFIAIVTIVFSFNSVQAQNASEYSENIQVIKLSQTPGEYETTSLDLKAGNYIFEVTNKNVDKDLGFYLTPIENAKAQIPNSGLAKLVGQSETSRTGIVELVPGEYQYSCPLNPTPHYLIKVTE